MRKDFLVFLVGCGALGWKDPVYLFFLRQSHKFGISVKLILELGLVHLKSYNHCVNDRSFTWVNEYVVHVRVTTIAPRKTYVRSSNRFHVFGHSIPSQWISRLPRQDLSWEPFNFRILETS